MKPESKKENPLDRLKDVLKTPTMPVHELPSKKDKKVLDRQCVKEYYVLLPTRGTK